MQDDYPPLHCLAREVVRRLPGVDEETKKRWLRRRSLVRPSDVTPREHRRRMRVARPTLSAAVKKLAPMVADGSLARADEQYPASGRDAAIDVVFSVLDELRPSDQPPPLRRNKTSLFCMPSPRTCLCDVEE